MKSFFALLLLALAGLASTSDASERQIKVTAKNFAFVPATITLKLHQPVKLVFMSTQGVHGITIPEIGLSKVVTITSKPVTVEETPSHAGTFVARCAIFCGVGHGRMVLTVKVVK